MSGVDPFGLEDANCKPVNCFVDSGDYHDDAKDPHSVGLKSKVSSVFKVMDTQVAKGCCIKRLVIAAHGNDGVIAIRGRSSVNDEMAVVLKYVCPRCPRSCVPVVRCPCEATCIATS